MDRYPNGGYIAELQLELEEESRLHDLQRQAEAKLAASIQTGKRPKPLEDQIVELMRTLPPQLRDRPWSMADLVTRLTGKYRERPAAQCVSAALLRLGWRKERRYGQGFGGVRVWLPG
jgi:hypothetical protein